MSRPLGGATRDFDDGAEVNAADLDIPLSPLPAEQVQEGAPLAGSVALGEFAGCEVGVWEHKVGASSDVEADELFVVLSGTATVEFIDDERVAHLGPGTVMRLEAGQRTVWTVTETLRKVYLS